MKGSVDADGFHLVRHKKRTGKKTAVCKFSCSIGGDLTSPFDRSEEETSDRELVRRSREKLKVVREALRSNGIKAEDPVTYLLKRCLLRAFQSIDLEFDGRKGAVCYKEQSRSVRILVYGLGNFSSSAIACQQLALTLELRDFFVDCARSIEFYDPVFLPEERAVLRSLGATRVERSDNRLKTGFGDFEDDEVPVLFLPHCPNEVSESVLRLHLDEPARPLVILGNDPGRILTSYPLVRELLAVLETKSFPLGVSSKSEHYLAFNDTSAYGLFTP